MPATRQLRIGVLGPGEATARTRALAEEIGTEIARRGAVLICGGLGGAMEAAARGAKMADGLTIGVLPGTNADDANPYIDIPLVTGMGEARNVVVVRSADAVIAIAGAFGTLSEIAFALKLGVPVIGLGTWQVCAPDGTIPPIIQASSAADAVAKAFAAIAAGSTR
jgi:uncharacterized protein (TIGR00725 family)